MERECESTLCVTEFIVIAVLIEIKESDFQDVSGGGVRSVESKVFVPNWIDSLFANLDEKSVSILAFLVNFGREFLSF